SAGGEAVQQLVDLVDQVRADALVQGPLLTGEVVTDLRGQRPVQVGVLRGGHLEGELGVLHREEPLRAGHPVHPRAARGRGGEQVAVDLGGGLAAAHDGDGARLQQVLLAVEVVGAVQDRGGAALPRERLERGREVRGGAEAERDVAGAQLLEARGGALGVEHGEGDQQVVALLLDREGATAPAQALQPFRDPAAVGVVLAAQRGEGLADVEGVEAPGGLEEGEERVGRGRVRHGHQVGEEGDLQGGSLDHHPGVPGEAVGLVDEDGVEVLEGRGEGGEPQAEGTDADADEVVDVLRVGDAHRVSSAAASRPPASSPRPVARTRSSTAATSVSVAPGFRRVSFSQGVPSIVVRATIARPEWNRIRRIRGCSASVRASSSPSGRKRKMTVERSVVPSTCRSGSSVSSSRTSTARSQQASTMSPSASGPSDRSVVQSFSASNRRAVWSDWSTWFGSASSAAASAAGLRWSAWCAVAARSALSRKISALEETGWKQVLW